MTSLRGKTAREAESDSEFSGLESDGSSDAGGGGGGGGGGAPKTAREIAALDHSLASGGVVTVPVGYKPHPELYTGAAPTRLADGTLVFSDAPRFRPNLTPAEILRAGSFGEGMRERPVHMRSFHAAPLHVRAGGTYFRDIPSGVTGLSYRDMWRCVPPEWLTGLSKAQYAAPRYDASVNAFGVKCGQSLDAWESSGWITAWDPYGWFHWYCRCVRHEGGGGGVGSGGSVVSTFEASIAPRRFYQGRRCPDDERQISRCVVISHAWCLARIVSRTHGVSHALCLARIVSPTHSVSHAWCLARVVSRTHCVSHAWRHVNRPSPPPPPLASRAPRDDGR